MSGVCKDCRADIAAFDAGDRARVIPSTVRPIVANSGGRCATHWRAEKARRKAAAHEKRVQKVYGLAEGDYADLYAYQGGKCAICRRATGRSKRLAVDHDHQTGEVRGLLCSTCNKIIGFLRDDRAAVYRMYAYLGDPPARALGIRAIHEEVREGG